MAAGGLCVFFNYLNADEELSYYGRFPKVAAVVRAWAGDPVIAGLAESCERLTGVELFAELETGARLGDVGVAKEVQMHLYLCVMHILERRYGPHIRSVGCYSGGAIPAFVSAGCFSFEFYQRELHAVIAEWLGGHVVRSLAEGGLSSAFLVDGEGRDVLTFVERYVRDRGMHGRMFVKDHRCASAFLIAGFTPEVTEVRAAAFDAFPGLAATSPKQRPADLAHLPLGAYREYAERVRKVPFAPPRYDIIGGLGERVPAGCDDPVRIQEAFIQAIFGLMDTGASLFAIRSRGERMLVVGSQIVRSFLLHGVPLDRRPESSIAGAEWLEGTAEV
jgi:hypothetical protein